MEFEHFRELDERLRAAVAATGQPRFEVAGRVRAVVLADELDATEALVVTSSEALDMYVNLARYPGKTFGW